MNYLLFWSVLFFGFTAMAMVYCRLLGYFRIRDWRDARGFLGIAVAVCFPLATIDTLLAAWGGL